jgi:hypothetical protein
MFTEQFSTSKPPRAPKMQERQDFVLFTAVRRRSNPGCAPSRYYRYPLSHRNGGIHGGEEETGSDREEETGRNRVGRNRVRRSGYRGDGLSGGRTGILPGVLVKDENKTSISREAFASAVQYKSVSIHCCCHEGRRHGTVISIYGVPLCGGFAAM